MDIREVLNIVRLVAGIVFVTLGIVQKRLELGGIGLLLLTSVGI
jgi:hypothetical protein